MEGNGSIIFRRETGKKYGYLFPLAIPRNSLVGRRSRLGSMSPLSCVDERLGD